MRRYFQKMKESRERIRNMRKKRNLIDYNEMIWGGKGKCPPPTPFIKGIGDRQVKERVRAS